MKLFDAFAAALALASTSAFAAGGTSGEPAGPSTQAAPAVSAALGSLDYTGFAGTCSNTGFSTTANASASFPGTVSVTGATQLNGTAYDTYGFSLGSPSAFSTGFGRTFTAPLASSTYTFVFVSTVSLGSERQGATTITINCNAGVFSATSVWQAAPPVIVPVGSPALYGLIGMLLVGFAGIALRRR